MAADGDVEIENTLERLETLVEGRVYESAVPDSVQIPTRNGKVLPYIVVDFGATVRSLRDRNIANPEKGQPHVLPVNIACIAGTARAARKTRKDVMDLLLDWRPSETADAYEAKGGYGTNRPATGNTPTRFVSGSFFESVINQGVDSGW